MSNFVKEWESDEFSLHLEDRDGYLYAHCYVYGESLSTMKKIRKVAEEATQWAYDDGYDGVHALTPNKKFAEFIPNSILLTDLEHEGKTYGVYKWVLK